MYEMKMSYRVSSIKRNIKINYERYKESRKTLMEAYKQASEKYQEEYKLYSQKIVDGTLTEDDRKPFEPNVPLDRSKTYENYISMLKTTTDPKIELNYGDYCKLVLDNWEFMREHISAITLYANSTSTSTMTASSLRTFADSYQSGHMENWTE